MEHFAGIDVSLELSSVCVVDTQGNTSPRFLRSPQVVKVLPIRNEQFPDYFRHPRHGALRSRPGSRCRYLIGIKSFDD
jgi:hypothetical protein